MIANQVVPIVSVSLALSALTYLVTPGLGRKLKKMKIVGIDVHKARRPRIPEMGGIAIFVPMIFLLLSAYLVTDSPSVLLVLASTVFFGMYGMLDDLVRLGKYQKLGLSAAIGIAMLVPLNLSFAAIPLLLLLTMGLGNVFNLFAGFNGLEVGCSSFVALFFSVLCLMTANAVPFYMSLGMFLILAAFLVHNKYPAKIFPGNIGTFTVGGFFAGVCLYYGLYHFIIPLLSLHIADMALKAASAGYFSSGEKAPTRVKRSDGVLVPRDDYLSLSRLVLKLRPMTERQLVNFFWTASLMIGISSLMITGVLL